jgi:3-oxoacyl-[acyl-carrier protein] reductase
MFTSIAGCTVVVTGGSKGIGKGIAKVFLASGANVMISGRDSAQLQATADELSAIGDGAVQTHAGDVSSREACQQLCAATVEHFGGIDILCANAGVFPEATLDTMTADDLQAVFATNVFGGFFAVQAALPQLRASGRGRIILTSSITGPITGFPGWAHYGASKAAQLGFMRTAAVELARDAITVNAVLPGNVLTEGLIGMGEDYLAAMAATVPAKKLGRVEDIGYAALFLATEEASYITGQSIVVDGGQTLPESLDAIR